MYIDDTYVQIKFVIIVNVIVVNKSLKNMILISSPTIMVINIHTNII